MDTKRILCSAKGIASQLKPLTPASSRSLTPFLPPLHPPPSSTRVKCQRSCWGRSGGKLRSSREFRDAFKNSREILSQGRLERSGGGFCEIRPKIGDRPSTNIQPISPIGVDFLFFFSFFALRFSFGLGRFFCCCALLSLSFFPLSPISVSPCLKMRYAGLWCRKLVFDHRGQQMRSLGVTLADFSSIS